MHTPYPVQARKGSPKPSRVSEEPYVAAFILGLLTDKLERMALRRRPNSSRSQSQSTCVFPLCGAGGWQGGAP